MGWSPPPLPYTQVKHKVIKYLGICLIYLKFSCHRSVVVILELVLIESERKKERESVWERERESERDWKRKKEEERMRRERTM